MKRIEIKTNNPMITYEITIYGEDDICVDFWKNGCLYPIPTCCETEEEAVLSAVKHIYRNGLTIA
jgi:hypothetical protein